MKKETSPYELASLADEKPVSTWLWAEGKKGRAVGVAALPAGLPRHGAASSSQPKPCFALKLML